MTRLPIEATGLTKSFGETKAPAGLNLTARKGSVLAVLGPNSPGKARYWIVAFI
jgi:ABC-type multidrug transport system ATPase subunit